MNRKFSVASLVGLGVAVAFLTILLARSSVTPFVKKSEHKHVVITIKDKKCSQTADGITDSFTYLRTKKPLFAGDSIQWAVKDLDHGATTFEITFPQQTPDGHLGTPFVDANNQPKFKFTDQDNESGPPPEKTAEGDYGYGSVKAGNFACENPGDPGGHVGN
jgi:hypothetical protein